MAVERRGIIDQSHTFNLEDGVVQEGALVWVPRKSQSQFGDRWFQMAQSTLQMMNKERKALGLEGFVVFHALLARLDWENFIQVSQTEIAEEVEMRKSNVSRAMKKLLDLGFVRQGPKVGKSYTYQLHPELAWKGKPKPHFQARESARREGWRIIEGGKPEQEQPELDR